MTTATNPLAAARHYLKAAALAVSLDDKLRSLTAAESHLPEHMLSQTLPLRKEIIAKRIEVLDFIERKPLFRIVRKTTIGQFCGSELTLENDLSWAAAIQRLRQMAHHHALVDLDGLTEEEIDLFVFYAGENASFTDDANVYQMEEQIEEKTYRIK